MAADWSEPGIDEVADGIFRTPLPMPSDGLRAVNVYILRHQDSVALVDGGWGSPSSMERLEESLGALGHSLSDVRDVYVTHAHYDHYTMAVWLRREVGSRVWVGEGERASLEWLVFGGDQSRHAHQRALLDRAGAEHLSDAMKLLDLAADAHAEGWELPDNWVTDGQLEETGQGMLSAIKTPGHTAGHTVFALAGRGLVFGGDHVLPHITPSIGFETVPDHHALTNFLNSLSRMLAEPDSTLLPAHGPVAQSVHVRSRELLQHHRARLSLTQDAITGRAGSDAFEVASRIPWTRHGRAFEELDEFNQTLATNETSMHLDWLAEHGESERLPPDRHGVVRYRVAG